MTTRTLRSFGNPNLLESEEGLKSEQKVIVGVTGTFEGMSVSCDMYTGDNSLRYSRESWLHGFDGYGRKGIFDMQVWITFQKTKKKGGERKLWLE